MVLWDFYFSLLLTECKIWKKPSVYIPIKSTAIGLSSFRKTKRYANKRRSQSITSANSLNSAVKSGTKKASTESEGRSFNNCSSFPSRAWISCFVVFFQLLENTTIAIFRWGNLLGKHSETPQRVLHLNMSSNMPKSDVVKTEANKRSDSEGKENNKVDSNISVYNATNEICSDKSLKRCRKRGNGKDKREILLL